MPETSVVRRGFGLGSRLRRDRLLGRALLVDPGLERGQTGLQGVDFGLRLFLLGRGGIGSNRMVGLGFSLGG